VLVSALIDPRRGSYWKQPATLLDLRLIPLRVIAFLVFLSAGSFYDRPAEFNQ
jgi:hypothetical protein